MFSMNDDTCKMLNNDQNPEASVATDDDSSSPAGSIKKNQCYKPNRVR